MNQQAYIISDTHLGAGAHDPLEDFFQDDAFRAFVGRIARSDTTLYLNGDFIDFVQIAPFAVPQPMHLLWDEAASLTKLETAITAHAGCFAALKELIAAGGRVVVTVGNHDLDLAWPGVQSRMRAELGNPASDRLRFVTGAEVFAGVHIEHGHAFTPENCPRDPLNFFHQADGKLWLERVWGTDFMLQFYNQLERDHPYADNVKPMLSVAWAGLRKRWIGAREILRMLVFLKKRGIPWQGIASSTLSQAQPVEPQLLAASFADGDWQQAIVERLQTDPGFAPALAQAAAELAPAERALAASPEAIGLGVDVKMTDAPAHRTMGVFRDDREHRAAKQRLQGGISAVVFGHSHELVDGATLDGELKHRLFNTGSWLPHLDLKSAFIRQKIKQEGLTEDMLKDKSLYVVERWAARISDDGRQPAQVQLVSCDG